MGGMVVVVWWPADVAWWRRGWQSRYLERAVWRVKQEALGARAQGSRPRRAMLSDATASRDLRCADAGLVVSACDAPWLRRDASGRGGVSDGG